MANNKNKKKHQKKTHQKKTGDRQNEEATETIQPGQKQQRNRCSCYWDEPYKGHNICSRISDQNDLKSGSCSHHAACWSLEMRNKIEWVDNNQIWKLDYQPDIRGLIEALPPPQKVKDVLEYVKEKGGVKGVKDGLLSEDVVFVMTNYLSLNPIEEIHQVCANSHLTSGGPIVGSYYLRSTFIPMYEECYKGGGSIAKFYDEETGQEKRSKHAFAIIGAYQDEDGKV